MYIIPLNASSNFPRSIENDINPLNIYYTVIKIDINQVTVKSIFIVANMI